MKSFFNICLTVFICAIILVLCACSKQSAPQEAPVKVKLYTVSEGEDVGLFYSASIDADKNINLSFLTVGTAAQINVREGDSVKKGQLLAQLDCISNQNSLQITQAKAQQARDAFNRFYPMYKNGNLPEIKMVEINTNLTQADLAVKLAQKSVEDCSIIAPANGMISKRDIENGDNIIPGKTVLQLVTLGKVYALISVPEKEIHQIYKGQKATVQLTAQKEGESFDGIVTDVGVSADPLSRTYAVRVKINNPKGQLLPGMLANVYLQTKDKNENAFVIPATALKQDGDGAQYVFIFNPQTKRVSKQIVQTGDFRTGGVFVQGLSEGQQIVAQGAQKLEDNSLAEVII